MMIRTLIGIMAVVVTFAGAKESRAGEPRSRPPQLPRS